MKRALLSPADAAAALQKLPGWQVEGLELVRRFTFPTYLAGIEFVRQLALAAEGMNHHPDLIVGWRQVTVRLTTHSAGGLTELDFALAQQATELV